MHPAVGTEIGIRAGDVIAEKYRVDRVLGVGGMGVVVAARHLRLEELVAIKVLLPEALTDPDAVRRFEREARAAVKIKNEHVTRIIDVGALDNGAPFIVMEYLDGEDLADRVSRTGPLAVEDAVELLLQACEAIAEAHTLGIVHRDLKPANLFCVQGADGRPSIKVLDFGISKLTQALAHGSGLGMTKTRAVMGSPYYMSPEQMQSPRTVDARTDIWSLGVVLYQLLTGDVPFSGETLPQVCVNVATRRAPPLRRRRPDAPQGLETIVHRCLEKDPNKRFASVAALAAALGKFGPRRAQISLDRIARTVRHAEPRAPSPVNAHQREAPARAVTGPLPSWGRTAKSRQGQARSAAGWVVGAAVAASAAFTSMWFESSRATHSEPAVLVTPLQTPERRMTTEADSAQSPASPTIPIVPTDTTARVGATPSMETTPPPRPVASETSPAPERRTSVEPPRPPPPSRPTAAPPTADLESNPYEPAPTPTAALATCVLNLNSLPPARVVLDGMPLGFTPKIGVTVPVGPHRVLFQWDDGDRHASVSCAKGETKTVAVRLSESSPSEDLPAKNPYR